MVSRELGHIERDAGIDTISMPSNTRPSTLRHLFFCGQLFGQLFGHADREALKGAISAKMVQWTTSNGIHLTSSAF